MSCSVRLLEPAGANRLRSEAHDLTAVDRREVSREPVRALCPPTLRNLQRKRGRPPAPISVARKEPRQLVTVSRAFPTPRFALYTLPPTVPTGAAHQTLSSAQSFKKKTHFKTAGGNFKQHTKRKAGE